MISRSDRSPLAEWWRTIDRPLLASLVLLAFCGFFLSFSASPPVAERIGVDEFHFIKRHALFFLPGMAVMVAISFLSPKNVRRVALLLFMLSIMMLLATLFIGSETKGSRRWIYIAGFTLQPSEFVKPAFVVVTAWLFAEGARRPDIPGNIFSIILFGIVAALLMAQPDLGQTMLVAAVWGALFFMAGMSWIWIAALGTMGIVGLMVAYLSLSHVASRIDRFILGEGDNYQVDTGVQAILNGGWLGQGPGDGTVKNILPDSHTDFSFAVAAEEFGIIACILLAGIYAFIVLRALSRALNERDDYVRMATAGLALQFGFQSMINIGVNLKLLPAKGMTLPFISYGGSSMLATAIGMGLLLALTRTRAETRQSSAVRLNYNTLRPAE